MPVENRGWDQAVLSRIAACLPRRIETAIVLSDTAWVVIKGARHGFADLLRRGRGNDAEFGLVGV